MVQKRQKATNKAKPHSLTPLKSTPFYHKDSLGTVTNLTDSAGTVAQSYQYDTFGNTTGMTGSTNQPFTFTGREFDPETGLYYYRARYYDPFGGRFISEDPIGFDRHSINLYSDINSVGKPQVNLYQYAENNSVNFIDPTGLWTLSIGLSINGQIGSININISGGIAVDSSGNIGTYTTGGGGLGIGAKIAGGMSISGSNAKTICDLSGPFASGSVGGGWGPNASGDYFTGSSRNGWVTGGGITIGAGLGAGGSSAITGTKVYPIWKLW